MRREPMGISECTSRRAPLLSSPAVTVETCGSSSAVWVELRFPQSREHQHLPTAARLETPTIHPDARAETQTGRSIPHTSPSSVTFNSPSVLP